MLQDDREVRPEMKPHLFSSGTLFDNLGKEHFLRNLKAAFAVLRNIPGSFVKRGRKRVALADEDFSGFLLELLRSVSGHRFGRLPSQEYLGSKLLKISHCSGIGVNFFPFLQAQGDRHRLA